MPSASTSKLEKQASTEAVEPIKQGIIIIEHKIRNLEKRKVKLDGYKALQKLGKELSSDQLTAVSKFDEVIQSLDFARELCKQFTTISIESAKQQKKQARKEALERTQQETNKVKEILLIQDVLANMGQENVREDFLAGNKNAIKLTEEDLQKLDELFVEVSPKREIEEGIPPFPEQLQKAAEHLINLVDGKTKEVIGTTYGKLKEQIISISTCGYFDQSSATAAPEEAEVPIPIPGQEETVAEDIGEEEEPATDTVPSETFQSMDGYASVQHQHVVEPTQHAVETAGLYISQRPVNDVLSNVMNSVTSSFSFIQESELETEVITPTPPPTTALPIPTQTFTNANYAAPPVNVSPAVQQTYPPQTGDILYTPIPMPPQSQQAQHIGVAQAQPSVPVPEPQSQAVYNNPASQPFSSQNQAMPAQQQYNSQPDFQHPIQSGGDWNEATEQTTTSDWAMESAEAGNWQNSDSNEWNEQQNDGFVPAGGRVSGNRNYGRGGRSGDRPRGRDNNYSSQRGSRGGGGNYSNNQNGRGGGGNYYRNNEGGNNYYQNGYQNRGDGERGYREGGYNKRGGSRGSGAPRQDRGERGDRGGPRQGGRGGNRGTRGGGGMNPRNQ